MFQLLESRYDSVKLAWEERQWVFTIPNMLRPLFFRRRELRGSLARLAWQTVRELMAAAVEEPDLRPGMVSVIQTFGDRINPHPHVHAIASRGGWTRDDRFIPIPYVDPHAAKELFRHKVIGFLQRKKLIQRTARGAALVVKALMSSRPTSEARTSKRSGASTSWS